MSLDQLQSFLGWCLVINIGIMFLWFASATFLSGMVVGIHGRLLRIAEEDIRRYLYLLLGQYKMLVTIFNFAPWLALYLMQR